MREAERCPSASPRVPKHPAELRRGVCRLDLPGVPTPLFVATTPMVSVRDIDQSSLSSGAIAMGGGWTSLTHADIGAW